LNHAVISGEKLRMRIDGKPFEQRLQFRPQPVAAQGGDGMEFAECREFPNGLVTPSGKQACCATRLEAISRSQNPNSLNVGEVGKN
jgi:hypothetical protein